jgi:metallo-beta-lactamase family protein
VLVESTYGDRDHVEDDNGEQLAQVIRSTIERGGKLIIPSFAIGRVEELLYWMRRLEQERRIPVLPVYVDSPMANEALKFYSARTSELDEDMRPTEKKVSMFATTHFQTVASPQQSKELTASRKPAVVISSSGMATGGRVLHHMAAALPDPRNTVLFVGFQAEGTLGRRLRDGAETVNIFGEPVRVAAEIASIDGFSAHADREEILAWVKRLEPAPKRIFLVHGEPAPAEALAELLRERLGTRVDVPAKGQEFELWN